MAYQEHYTQQLLDNLRAKLLIMGSKTQQALDDAAIAVLNHDLPRAAAVLDGDTDIDDLENQIDEATLNILARTQPVARDLRFLMSVVRMVLDLERIGDESVVVAEQVTLSDKPIPSIVEKDLRALCTRTSAMLRNSLLAFQNGDAPSALAVSRYDDETAQMMVNIFQKLMQAVGDLNIPVIVIFVVGAAAGIISFSHLLSWLLKHWHDVTVAVLMGFMVGSLNKVWPWKEVVETYTDSHGKIMPLVESNVAPGRFEALTQQDALLAEAIVLCIVGFLAIYCIELAARIVVKKQEE